MEVNRHPLTIDVIVQEVLRHVSPSMKDLLVFRQVCRLWRELATPQISSKSLELPLITFKAETGTEGNAEDSKADCKGCNPEYSLLPKYIDYLESDAEQKIIFSVFHFNDISLDHPIVQKFLQEFGRTVKKLHLNQTDYNKIERQHLRTCAEKVNPQTFRRLLLSCPNLEEIFFGRVDPKGGGNGFLLPEDDFQTRIKRMAWAETSCVNSEYRPQKQFVSDMLKVCPSLERFLTEYMDDGSQTITALSESPHLSALKELTIPRDCQSERGDVLLKLIQGEQEGKLKLRKLKFDEVHVTKPEEFCRFMDSQKSSLETLIVKDWRVDSFEAIGFHQLPRVQFPDVMGKLEVLKIARPFSLSEEMDEEPDPILVRLLFEPLDFSRQFPVLKTLILGGYIDRYDLNDLFAPGWEPQMVLDGLELPWGIEHDDLRRIAELFPNIKHLTLRGVEEEALRMLWTLWPLLESLFLDLREVEDQDANIVVDIETALTGLSSEQIPLVQSLTENGEEINIQAENPSIVNFQNLRELRIFEFEENANEIVPNRPGAYLSDVSIHYALSKLLKLEFFGVNRHKFTEKGINFLCKGNGLKVNKNGDWILQCQKNLELEYKHRPNCDEDFADYEIDQSKKKKPYQKLPTA